MHNFKGKYGKRRIAFICSFGSTNYGTRDETSDNDYKVYLLPTADDLYEGKFFKHNCKIDGDDYEFKDVRLLPNLLAKANPAYLEILEAKEVYIPEYSKGIWGWLQNNKFAIAKMNMIGLYNALNGISMQKLKAIENDLPNSQENEGYKRRMKFGFDSKQLMHIVRLLTIKEEVFVFEKNYLSCIDLDSDKPYSKHGVLHGLKQYLLDIKQNKSMLDKKEAIKFAKHFMKIDFFTKEELSKKFEFDEKLKQKMEEQVKRFVLKESN